MSVSKRTRFEVLRRDNHTCRYCGGTAPDVKLTVDHVIPTTLGGSDAPDNLVAACADCNSGKSSVPPDAPLVADVQRDALRWGQAVRAAAEIIAAERESQADYIAAFEVAWDRYQIGGAPVPRPDYVNGLIRLHQAGLPEVEMLSAVEATMRAWNVAPDNRVRYFMGVAWNSVHRLHQIASDLVRKDP